MAGEKILVVDNQVEIAGSICKHLERGGFRVSSLNNGKDALLLVNKLNPDFIVLEMQLPDMDGIEICKQLRKITSVPIIFISNSHEEIDKILALEVGGDDYLTKPLSLRELVARIKAHLRRSIAHPTFSPNKESLLKYEELEIDPASHTVSINQRLVNLSAKEFQLLYHLALNPNRIYNNDQLFNLLWGTDSLGDVRTVMVHISNLRKKIEQDPSNPKFVTTIRGVGYKFTG